MRIAIDGRLYGLENAGLGRYLINLIQEISALDNRNEYFLILKKRYFNELVLPANWTKVLADIPHYSFSEQIEIPKLLSRLSPDLVHFPHMNVPRFYKGKFIVTVHDLLMQKHRGSAATTLPFYTYFPKLIASKYIFNHAVKNATKILVPSFAVKSEVQTYFKISDSKIKVTYEGVDKKFNTTTSLNILNKYNIKNDYFLYVGNAYPHKNLERTIKAIKETNSHLIIVTPRNIFSKKLSVQITKLNANKNVHVIGFVEDSDLVSLYKNSLGFIYPSLSEGFGLPGLEAMKSETLLLASEIPVFKEIYKDAPLYFDPYSVDSIKETIIKTKNLPESQRKLKTDLGLKKVSKYSWKSMAQQTLDTYKEVLSLKS